MIFNLGAKRCFLDANSGLLVLFGAPRVRIGALPVQFADELVQNCGLLVLFGAPRVRIGAFGVQIGAFLIIKKDLFLVVFSQPHPGLKDRGLRRVISKGG